MDKPAFKVIIAGGRYFQDYTLLCKSCDYALQHKHTTHDIVIVSGKARGADSLGERYAAERGYAVEEFPADWDTYGKAAGHRRNADMRAVADALIAFWDGESRGTKNMIDQMNKVGKPTKIVRYTK